MSLQQVAWHRITKTKMWDVAESLSKKQNLHSSNLFRWISATLNEMLNVDALDLRVTRPVRAADGGRMWARAEEFACSRCERSPHPTHRESLCGGGPAPKDWKMWLWSRSRLVFSPLSLLGENQQVASQQQLRDSWTFSTQTVEWLIIQNVSGWRIIWDTVSDAVMPLIEPKIRGAKCSKIRCYVIQKSKTWRCYFPAVSCIPTSNLSDYVSASCSCYAVKRLLLLNWHTAVFHQPGTRDALGSSHVSIW